MVVISGKSLLIHYLLVLLVSSFTKLTHVKGFDLGDLFDFPPDPFPYNYDYEQSPVPRVIEPRLQVWPPPPPSPPPPPPPSPPSPPPPKQSPPPPSTDSFFIPPFVIPPIDIPPLIPPLLPVISSIINPITSSPPLLKSPSQCKPDKSIKLTPPPPAKQPPVKAPPPPPHAPSPSPARQPTPPPVKAPFPSPARQPTPPPVKPPSPSPPPPPPPLSKKSPPPAPPPSIANPPIMAPSPSPAPHPPVIIAPFPSSPVAKPPVIPRRPVKPILPPSPAVKTLTVNGIVYCKPCNSYGVPNLLNATPLQGASARLVCYNGKNAIVQSAITDKNGEFRLTPKSLIGADIGKCKVYLVKSPNPTCNVPTNFNGGKTGALLQHVVPPKPPIVTPAVIVPVQPPMSDLYGVGPFIFEASSKVPCAMHRKL
ncbi:pistil-specific extensin-like protein [Solanum tuberosum]|uniref:Pistil extensin n=1 Tax=Solanum tuberosum TaxID=4113 RepID=M1CWM2_SOLTU|nr:PREDICTED: pistil-specific extensin-like protein [Solanum tuberosum]KAH0699728.1 hypothetical protein KY284_013943 [Solanum tuberosum]